MDQQLLSQLLANQQETQGAGPQPAGDLSALLASRFQDPVMAALVGSMLQNSRSRPAEAREDHDQALARAQASIRRLQEDLAAADVMAQYIADIFGACPACWGLNRMCSQCQGHGQPGSQPPLADELLAWIEPALIRLGLQTTRIAGANESRGADTEDR